MSNESSLLPKKWISFLLFILLFILCFLSVIYSPAELTFVPQSESKRTSLQMVIIEKRNGNLYEIETRFTKEKCTVLCNADFEKGDTVSFYGDVENGVLIAEDYHIHNYPDFPYYISVVGLVFALFVFYKEWKIDLRHMCFIRRRG